MTNWLVELTAYDPVATDTATLYFATQGFVTSPTDNPANQHFEPRVLEPGNFERHLFTRGSTSGPSSVGVGEIVLVNSDGGLDAYREWGFDGRTLRIMKLDGVAYTEAVVWFRGTVEQIEFNWSQVSVRMRDRLAELDKPIQPAKFDGSNIGPLGIEGTDSDLSGREKPQVWGKVKNVSPAAVNTSALIFGVNWDETGATKPVNSIDAVYDNGVLLSSGTDRADLTTLQENTPAAGQVDTCIAEGLFKLGSSPAGQITCDVTEGETASERSAAKIVKRILLGPGGLQSADLDDVSFNDLHATNNATCGFYVSDNQTILESCTAVLGSLGAWLLPSRNGVFQIGQFAAPVGVPRLTLTDNEILVGRGGLARQATGDNGAGIPAWRVNINYQRNWTVQKAGELGGAVTDSRRVWLELSERASVVEDESIQNHHLLAPELTFTSLFDDEVDANAEASRRLLLYKAHRDRFKLKLANEFATGLELGDVIELSVNRFGLNDGKLFLLIGVTEVAGLNTVELDLWG